MSCSSSLRGSAGKWRVMKVNNDDRRPNDFSCRFPLFSVFFVNILMDVFYCFALLYVWMWRFDSWEKIFIEIMKGTMYTLCTIIIKINWLTIKLPSLICFLKTKETGAGNVIKLQFHCRRWLVECCVVTTCLKLLKSVGDIPLHCSYFSVDFFNILTWVKYLKLIPFCEGDMKTVANGRRVLCIEIYMLLWIWRIHCFVPKRLRICEPCSSSTRQWYQYSILSQSIRNADNLSYCFSDATFQSIGGCNFSPF